MYAIVKHAGGGCQDPRGGVRFVTLVADLDTAKQTARDMVKTETKKLNKWYVAEPLEALANWDGAGRIDCYIDVDFEWLCYEGVSVVSID